MTWHQMSSLGLGVTLEQDGIVFPTGHWSSGCSHLAESSGSWWELGWACLGNWGAQCSDSDACDQGSPHKEAEIPVMPQTGLTMDEAP